MKQSQLILIGAAVLGGVALLVRQAQAAGGLVNPVDRGNLASRAGNALGDVLNNGVRDGDFNLGVEWWNFWNDGNARVIDGRIVLDDAAIHQAPDKWVPHSGSRDQ